MSSREATGSCFRPDYAWKYYWSLRPGFLPNQLPQYLNVKRVLEREKRGTHNSPILEIGAGGVPLYKVYNKEGPQICIDFDLDLVRRNKRLTRLVGLLGQTFGGNKQDVEFVAADNACMPFRDGSFDTIVGVHCFEPVGSRAKELQRVLRKKGEYIQSYFGVVSIHKKETLLATLKAETERIRRWIREKYGV
jgi:SAM-dependent methyltransferase